MKIHQLKITVQDVPDKDGNLFAALFSTVIIDTGEVAKDAKGEDRLDEEGQKIPVLENIDTVVPLNANADFKKHIQALVVEAITLKNLKIAGENGQMSHFLEFIGDGEGAKKVKRKKKDETEKK